MRSLGGVIVDPADIHIKQILAVNYDALKVVYASNSRIAIYLEEMASAETSTRQNILE